MEWELFWAVVDSILPIHIIKYRIFTECVNSKTVRSESIKVINYLTVN